MGVTAVKASFFLTRKLRSALRRLLGIGTATKQARSWRDVERFPEAWSGRIQVMAEHVTPGSSVADMGCGPMRLRRYIRDCAYIPVDYCDRGPGTVICDFNKDTFPALEVDCIFVSGCLEYVDLPEEFIKNISNSCRRCVISYCSVDYSADIESRAHAGWVNHLTEQELITLFRVRGMELVHRSIYGTENSIFVFKR